MHDDHLLEYGEKGENIIMVMLDTTVRALEHSALWMEFAKGLLPNELCG